jgi:hypothetical protein
MWLFDIRNFPVISNGLELFRQYDPFDWVVVGGNYQCVTVCCLVSRLDNNDRLSDCQLKPITAMLHSTVSKGKPIFSSLAKPSAPMLGISASIRQAAENALAVAVQSRN